MLRLTLVPGLGPVLISRLIQRLGSAEAVLAATPSALRAVKGIGEGKSELIEEVRKDLDRLAEEEWSAVEGAGIHLVVMGEAEYPALLAHIDDPPPVLYVRGELRPHDLDRAMLAIVGSRKCSHYGLEQAARFARTLAQSGVTIVSGGARGIDTAAHRGAIDAGGRTVAVMGCGLARAYPPENEDLFARIAERGCVLSELPFRTPPTSENFPARNRIISGLAHGTLVIEAGHRSGSLITARLAAEDHGREVFALPGRVDSACSAGSLDLIKSGGAMMVTEPADVLNALRDATTFGVQPPEATGGEDEDGASAPGGLFARDSVPDRVPDRRPVPGMRPLAPFMAPEVPSAQTPVLASDPVDARIIEALDEPLSPDQLATRVQLQPHELRSRLTMLEIQRRVRRVGTSIERVR